MTDVPAAGMIDIHACCHGQQNLRRMRARTLCTRTCTCTVHVHVHAHVHVHDRSTGMHGMHFRNARDALSEMLAFRQCIMTCVPVLSKDNVNFWFSFFHS